MSCSKNNGWWGLLSCIVQVSSHQGHWKALFFEKYSSQANMANKCNMRQQLYVVMNQASLKHNYKSHKCFAFVQRREENRFINHRWFLWTYKRKKESFLICMHKYWKISQTGWIKFPIPFVLSLRQLSRINSLATTLSTRWRWQIFSISDCTFIEFPVEGFFFIFLFFAQSRLISFYGVRKFISTRK